MKKIKRVEDQNQYVLQEHQGNVNKDAKSLRMKMSGLNGKAQTNGSDNLMINSLFVL